jgi:hypothetical protein
MARMIKGFIWGILIVLAVWFFYGCARSSGFVALDGAPINYMQSVDNKVQYY